MFSEQIINFSFHWIYLYNLMFFKSLFNFFKWYGYINNNIIFESIQINCFGNIL